MKVYTASSWKNRYYDRVVESLRINGHEVYDFRTHSKAFRWTEIDPNWERWTYDQYIKALEHPKSIWGYQADMHALESSDACVLILPSGRSAHAEFGYATGIKKITAVLIGDERDTRGHSMDRHTTCSKCGDLDGCHLVNKPSIQPDLMYKMADLITNQLEDVLNLLRR